MSSSWYDMLGHKGLTATFYRHVSITKKNHISIHFLMP